MKRTKIIDALASTAYGTEITVMGWVRSKRGSKNVNFIALNDGSTIRNIQIVADVEKFEDELLRQIGTGASIACTGKLVESQGAGQATEILAASIRLFGACAPDYPMQK